MLGMAFSWLTEGRRTGSGRSVPWPRRVETVLRVNRTPIERWGMTVQTHARWLDGASRATPEVAMTPGMTGGRYGGIQTLAPLTVDIVGTVFDITLEEEHAITNRLYREFSGLLELEWPHAPGQVQYGMAGPMSWTTIDGTPSYAYPDALSREVSFPIVCSDTVRWARRCRRLIISTTPKPILLGNQAVGGLLKVQGPLSGSVNIDLLSPSGVLLERLALRGVSLADGDVLEIRLDAPTLLIKRTALGVETKVYAWRSVTESTRWWKVSPLHADPERGQYPLLRMSTGSALYEYLIGEAA